MTPTNQLIGRLAGRTVFFSLRHGFPENSALEVDLTDLQSTCCLEAILSPGHIAPDVSVETPTTGL